MTLPYAKAIDLLSRAKASIEAAASHPADSGTASQRARVRLALADAQAVRLQYLREQLDNAFRRLEAGLFGACRSCGVTIDVERLEDDPLVATCSPCAFARSL